MEMFRGETWKQMVRGSRRVRLAFKRSLDIAVGMLSLIALSPVFVIVSVLILLAEGKPIIFRQSRLGREGAEFVLYKFRTMTGEKDTQGRLLPDGQRVTRVGRFLRRTTLDELPELFNVLKGDLSLVGPRPLLPEYRDFYTARQWERHKMPPGMAGLAVARGRNALTWEEKFELDVWYVEHWSLSLDLKIFLLCAKRLVTGEGVNQPGHATVEYFAGPMANVGRLERESE